MYGYGFFNRTLPIGVKFCTAVRPDLRQVFSYIWGNGWPNFGHQQGAVWRDMLLAEALVYKPVVFSGWRCWMRLTMVTGGITTYCVAAAVGTTTTIVVSVITTAMIIL